MTCEHSRSELSSLLDDELAADVARGVRAHLEACPACRQELEALRGLSAVLATGLEPDPGFIVRFRERRDQVAADAMEWLPWRRWATRLAPLAAAAVIGLATGLWISVPSEPWMEPGDQIELAELEMLEWGTDQAFASAEVAAQPVLHIAMEPFPGGEP
jgi:anti-sigma factor RsiW